MAVPFFVEKLLAIETPATLNVNSATYIRLVPFDLGIDFTNIPWTHFRLRSSLVSNAAGQTVTLQLATSLATPGTPVHSGGNDLVITTAAILGDSGWRTVDAALSGANQLTIAVKGSNATVDLNGTWLEIWWKYDP